MEEGINVYNDKRNGGRFWRTCEYEYTSPPSQLSPPPLSTRVSSPLSLTREREHTGLSPRTDRVYTHTGNDNATTRARSTFPTGQIFLIFFLVIGGKRGACTTTLLLVRPSAIFPRKERSVSLLLIRCDSVLSIFLSPAIQSFNPLFSRITPRTRSIRYETPRIFITPSFRVYVIRLRNSERRFARYAVYK